jgi:hypothetical protein
MNVPPKVLKFCLKYINLCPQNNFFVPPKFFSIYLDPSFILEDQKHPSYLSSQVTIRSLHCQAAHLQAARTSMFAASASSQVTINNCKHASSQPSSASVKHFPLQPSSANVSLFSLHDCSSASSSQIRDRAWNNSACKAETIEIEASF